MQPDQDTPRGDERSADAPGDAPAKTPVSAQSAVAEEGASPAPVSTPKKRPKVGDKPNNVRKYRLERLLSKAELARRANVSVLTIDRVEKGFGCRLDTKRKILEALGLSLAERVSVFGEEE